MADEEVTKAMEEMRTLMEIAERAFTIASFNFHEGSEMHDKLRKLGNNALSSVFAYFENDED